MSRKTKRNLRTRVGKYTRMIRYIFNRAEILNAPTQISEIYSGMVLLAPALQPLLIPTRWESHPYLASGIPDIVRRRVDGYRDRLGEIFLDGSPDIGALSGKRLVPCSTPERDLGDPRSLGRSLVRNSSRVPIK